VLKLRKERHSQSSWCSASKEDLQAAVQSLRENLIAYIGPFVIKSGVAVFKVEDYLLTADELVNMHKSGNLTKKGLSTSAGSGPPSQV
jgi:hypothetical protein